MQNKKFIKIIEIKPINFNFQILIQSNKEDLSNHFSQVRENSNLENKNIQEISEKYINYIKEINNNNKSSSKNYYIIINYENTNNEIQDVESYAIEDLNNKYFKIKDCLARCGNNAINILNKEEIKEILFSFLNTRKYFNRK